MKLPSVDQITREHLILWIIHRISDEFQNHAILKGGMQLALLSSQRQTNDVDYTFVPFASKKEIIPKLDQILEELPEAKIEKSMHSNSGRYIVSIGSTSAQIEFNVKKEEKSSTVSTQLLANRLGSLPQVVRVMEPSVALSHKLAAWNERRIIRDLYDVYYWYAIVKVKCDKPTLLHRLEEINSRIPKLKSRKKMSITDFITEMNEWLDSLDEARFINELSPLISIDLLEGVFMIFCAQLRQLLIELGVNDS